MGDPKQVNILFIERKDEAILPHHRHPIVTLEPG
jgi:hypothetical protein